MGGEVGWMGEFGKNLKQVSVSGGCGPERSMWPWVCVNVFE